MPDPRLAELVAYLTQVTHDTSHANFWAGWDALAGDLADQAWAEDVDPWLREAFTDLLAAADDAGWAVPEEQIQP